MRIFNAILVFGHAQISENFRQESISLNWTEILFKKMKFCQKLKLDKKAKFHQKLKLATKLKFPQKLKLAQNGNFVKNLN